MIVIWLGSVMTACSDSEYYNLQKRGGFFWDTYKCCPVIWRQFRLRGWKMLWLKNPGLLKQAHFYLNSGSDTYWFISVTLVNIAFYWLSMMKVVFKRVMENAYYENSHSLNIFFVPKHTLSPFFSPWTFWRFCRCCGLGIMHPCFGLISAIYTLCIFRNSFSKSFSNGDDINMDIMRWLWKNSYKVFNTVLGLEQEHFNNVKILVLGTSS